MNQLYQVTDDDKAEGTRRISQKEMTTKIIRDDNRNFQWTEIFKYIIEKE